ncbi:hypothetical protein PENDEC_c003G01520 [Penicillium decumbens]|uniref:Uncharacterized protein n=1 Tax=Penicillium decumbens TaxID=69771 RepID=A0A1V6PKS1_PENDC|nr:hypothetical protein PENDEC_c003G01520 [Penicillium decumbens]
MAKILSVHPLGWELMKGYWWQSLLIGVLLTCITIESAHISWSVGKKIIKFYKTRALSDKVPTNIGQRIDQLACRGLNLVNTYMNKQKPKSFGVYLGSFEKVQASQECILEKWDLLIVDPFQTGVAEAIQHTRSQVLGRIDLARVVSPEETALSTIETIEMILANHFNHTAFSGILFANWEDLTSPSIQARLFEAIRSLGLVVYLETGSPDFLKNRKALQNSAVSGLVICNASILPTGEKRDYFQMVNLQSTIKAFVSESCMRDFAVLSWEIINDDVVLSNAIVRRSLSWCNFYSAIPWISPEASLHNADLNIQTLEPLSAFGWLKDADVMKVHDSWRSNFEVSRHSPTKAGWDTLRPLFSTVNGLLDSEESENRTPDGPLLCLRDPPEWVAQVKSQGNPLSVSTSGQVYGYLGCFPLGSDATPMAFAEILQSQQRLKELSLLHPVPATKVHSIGILLRRFQEAVYFSEDDGQLAAAIKELAHLAVNDALTVNLALDSGLRKASDSRFWAVYELEDEKADIFVSKNAQGLAGTVLHTFLSAKGFPRHVSFETETALAEWSRDLAPNTGLPRRVVQDIDVLCPEERLLLLQHLSLTDVESGLNDKICAYIRKQLVDAPSLAQLKELNTVNHLNGSITPEDLVKSRINWYKDQQRSYPSFAASLDLFYQIDNVFTQVLKDHREKDLADITKGLDELMQDNTVDAFVDMMALALFCAARKGAFDEIYAEVTDRNPLFNNHSDQAAAFAESFALGSRCEAYFDVNPSVFGKLLSDRFRAYYTKNQPPNWVNGAPELATAYAGAQIDCDPDDKAKALRGYQRFTFLSVFAIPALVDILLLTFVGRGLYLSAYMTHDEQDSATLALMISLLLLSGAIGTWIACGGPYYLISMAFAAANMFVLTRLIAGIAFTVAGGLIGFVAISSVRGPRAGIIFYLYLVALTIYFSAFASLASFSYPGSAFLSGRKGIIVCIPILFLSPIITTFAGHDSAIYLTFIYLFIGVVLLCLRSTTSNWATWYQSIRRTDDTEIRKWYISTHGNNDEKVFGNLSDPAALKLAREALLIDVMAEKTRRVFTKSTTDQLVNELARDWDSTNFLLDWYCRYADVPPPIPFSSGWNIQTKVALDTLRNSQKGLKLHNAFVHWRQSSKEIGCGVLYFVIALLDKWVLLLTGNHLLGPTASLADANRMAVGFALAYYLIGAVLIDTKAQELHVAIGGKIHTAVKDANEIRTHQKGDVQFRRKVYWRTLFKFLLWHVWSLAVSTALIWSFQQSVEAMIIFFTYVFSYTGLIWYQYTKIFLGPHGLKPLLVGVCVGLPVGIALKICLPKFMYAQVIGLGSATWTVGILAFLTSKMSMPRKVESAVALGKSFHAFTTPWADPEWSQQELQTFFETVSLLPEDSRFAVDPTAHPGLEIKNILLSHC